MYYDLTFEYWILREVIICVITYIKKMHVTPLYIHMIVACYMNVDNIYRKFDTQRF